MNAPLYPAWEESIRIEDEGFIGIVLRPVHLDMPQEILFKIFTPHGFPAYSNPQDLIYPAPGQPDTAADMAAVEQYLHQLLASAKS